MNATSVIYGDLNQKEVHRSSEEEFSPYDSDIHDGMRSSSVSESSTNGSEQFTKNEMESGNGTEKSTDFLDEAMLEQHFEFRDKLLCICLKNIKNPEKQMELVKNYEKTFRSVVMALSKKERHETVAVTYSSTEHKECQGKDQNDEKLNKKSVSAPIPETHQSRFEKLRRFFKFEVQFGFPGLLNCLVYCLAHAAVHDLLDDIISEIAKSFANQDLVYLGVLVMGLVLARITGGVWIWISEETENKLKEQNDEYESLMMFNWFCKHEDLKEWLNLLSYILCYISVSMFYDVRLSKFFDCRQSILDGLPSTEAGAYTHISEILSTQLPGHLLIARRFAEQAQLDGDFLEESNMASSLLEQDECYLYNHLTLDGYQGVVGDPNETIWSTKMSLIHSFSVSLLAILLLKKLGMRFWVLDD